MASRKALIVGNWKMKLSAKDSVALAEAVAKQLGSVRNADLGVACAAPLISSVLSCLTSTEISCVGQDCSEDDYGAHTGDIAAQILKDTGCRYCIVGHSERRHTRGERSETVAKKIARLLEAQLVPILCIGETLAVREAGDTLPFLTKQLSTSLGGTVCKAEDIVIAYEPVWAIGTGKTATPDQAQEVHAFLRGALSEHFGSAFAERVRIQYGGSVKPKNAKALLVQPDIDGALVGGASLDVDSFAAIVSAA